MKGSRGQRSPSDGNNTGALQEGDRRGGGLQVFRAPTVQWGSWETCASALAQGDITFQSQSYKLGTRRLGLPSSGRHEESIWDTEGDGDSVEDKCRASASPGRHQEQERPQGCARQISFHSTA